MFLGIHGMLILPHWLKHGNVCNVGDIAKGSEHALDILGNKGLGGILGHLMNPIIMERLLRFFAMVPMLHEVAGHEQVRRDIFGRKRCRGIGIEKIHKR